MARSGASILPAVLLFCASNINSVRMLMHRTGGCADLIAPEVPWQAETAVAPTFMAVKVWRTT